jgi:hypothetical protein
MVFIAAPYDRSRSVTIAFGVFKLTPGTLHARPSNSRAATSKIRLVLLYKATVADLVGGQYGGTAALHPRSPFRERLAEHKGKIYIAGAGSNVAYWLRLLKNYFSGRSGQQ